MKKLLNLSLALLLCLQMALPASAENLFEKASQAVGGAVGAVVLVAVYAIGDLQASSERKKVLKEHFKGIKNANKIIKEDGDVNECNKHWGYGYHIYVNNRNLCFEHYLLKEDLTMEDCEMISPDSSFITYKGESVETRDYKHLCKELLIKKNICQKISNDKSSYKTHLIGSCKPHRWINTTDTPVEDKKEISDLMGSYEKNFVHINSYDYYDRADYRRYYDVNSDYLQGRSRGVSCEDTLDEMPMTSVYGLNKVTCSLIDNPSLRDYCIKEYPDYAYKKTFAECKGLPGFHEKHHCVLRVMKANEDPKLCEFEDFESFEQYQWSKNDKLRAECKAKFLKPFIVNYFKNIPNKIRYHSSGYAFEINDRPFEKKERVDLCNKVDPRLKFVCLEGVDANGWEKTDLCMLDPEKNSIGDRKQCIKKKIQEESDKHLVHDAKFAKNITLNLDLPSLFSDKPKNGYLLSIDVNSKKIKQNDIRKFCKSIDDDYLKNFCLDHSLELD